MFRKLLLMLAFALVSTGLLAIPKTTKSPVYNGVTARVDLPASQHMRNTGGSDGPRGPGSGSGLCVWTSLEMAGEAQGIEPLKGLQKWMTYRPGGGYPQKVTSLLPKFCESKGVKTPAYIQHTGGDAEFLDLVIKTGRFLSVTYGGYDDFYRGYVAHMVNCPHIDPQYMCFIDNNRPGSWVWGTREEGLKRWTMGGNGGWAVAFLDNPLAPAPKGTPVYDTSCKCTAGEECSCGETCHCEDEYAAFKVGQCQNGICTLPAEPTITWEDQDGKRFAYRNNKFLGMWDDLSGWHPAVSDTTYSTEVSFDVPWVWNQNAVGVFTGVDVTKIPQDGPHYSLTRNGVTVELTREAAFEIVGGVADIDGLQDDSNRWFLTVVTNGDVEVEKARIKSDPKLVPFLDKLHINVLSPNNATQKWYLDTRMKNVKVRFQKPITADASIVYESTDLDWNLVLEEILKALDPNYKPIPKPTPTPTPNDPLTPPAPVQPFVLPDWVNTQNSLSVVAILGVLYFFYRERRKLTNGS